MSIARSAKASLPLPPAYVTRDFLDAARYELCRRQCIAGNPFPLMAFRWPSLLITDPEEAQFFEGVIDDDQNPCLRIDTWQRQLIQAAFSGRVVEICTKGCTKAGKGTSVSILVNLWFDVHHESCRVILTSQRHKHAVDVIFAEVVKWRERMACPHLGKLGNLQAEGVDDGPHHYISVENPAVGEGFSGQHARNTLFVFDEATSIPKGRYEDAQKQSKLIVCLANPRHAFGWFRDCYPATDPDITREIPTPHGYRLCMTVGGKDCCNVRNRRLERALAPVGGITIDGIDYIHVPGPGGRIDIIPPEHFAKVRPLIPEQIDYGRYMGIMAHADPNHSGTFGDGKFPKEDPELQLIPSTWLAIHVAEHRERGRDIVVEAFGLDVGRSHAGDSSILSAGGKYGMREQHERNFTSTMDLVAWVIHTAKSQYGIDLTLGQHPVCVDVIGVGSGVVDRLKECGVWILEHNGSSRAEFEPQLYGNKRAESYGELSRRFNPQEYWDGAIWAIPDDPMLIEELVAPKKIYSSDGRFLITPKRSQPGRDLDEEKNPSIEKMIGRSPDKGDSCSYLYCAVRKLHLIDDLVLMNRGKVIAYPQPAPKPDDGLSVSPQEKNRRAAELEAREKNDMLNWARARYQNLS